MGETHGRRWTLPVLKGLAERWPRLRPLLPAAVLAASWPACLAGDGPLVAFLGDSFTSGWGLRETEAYPALVAHRLARQGRPIRVLNAGVSGDTVRLAQERLPQVLGHHPDVLVVALGVNDGLRGEPLDQTESGLRRILTEARSARVRVLLVGFRIPPLWGVEHAHRFAELFPRLAAEHRVMLVPDLLEGVSGEPALLFPDLLHPNGSGQIRLAENVHPHLELLLAEVEAERRRSRRRAPAAD